VRELIESGTCGKPLQYVAAYYCNSLHTEWWRDVTKSGGQLLEQMIHLYDMSRHLLGEAKGVAAIQESLAHQRFPDYTVEDASAALIKFESGALASITGSNNAVPGRWSGDVSLICEKMMVKDLVGPEATLFHHDGPDSGESVTLEKVRNDADPYRAETQSFFDAIRGSRKSAVPIQEGLRDLKLVTAAVQSAASATWADL
jgi:predicted dehydrogenase